MLRALLRALFLLWCATGTSALACDAFGTVQPDTELNGPTISSNGVVTLANAADVSDCCTTCASESDCFGFVVLGATCYLKGPGPLTTTPSLGRRTFMRVFPPSPPADPPSPPPPMPQSCLDQLDWNEYELVADFSGTSFFDGWTFTTTDANFGAAHYLSREEAWANGLVEAHDGYAILRTGSRSYANGYKRKSVRLETTEAWDNFLVAMHLTHVPVGCGIWPAWWTHSHEPGVVSQRRLAVAGAQTSG